ncbi:MAG: thiol reductant ABC exporter subunit CydD [Dactylosporangium sp.]|nr:thiol reductant ABC exporter subunit CydD [Dactylosporangium sp.]NNJ60577.1 thiol reductant ABC exporter subunit CydD [Dactylosporangium sp.]
MRPLDPRLLRHARATRSYLAACVGLGLLAAGLIVANATLLAAAIARVFPRSRTEPGAVTGLAGLGWLLAAVATVIAARAAVGWAQEVAAHRAAAAVKSDLRNGLLAHVARLGPGWLTGKRSGELVTLSGPGLDALDAYFSRYLPQLVLAALVPTIVLARILPADRVATVTIVLTLPLIPVFMVLIGLHTEQANRRQFRLLSRLAHHFLDVVAGLPTLKAYRRAAAQESTIRAVTSTHRQVTMRTLRIAFLSSLALELLATLSVALVAVGIGLRLVEGRLDFETALLVLILAPEAYLPIRQVGVNYHAAAEGLAAAEEVFAVIETPGPARGQRAHVPDLGTTPIKLVDVTVRYPDRPAPAVREFHLTVSPGEIVALTGPSGSGKSTVLAAILGFVRPEAGSLSAGGVELSDLDLTAWRRSIAWVPQHPWLFAGTLTDNIRLGVPDAGPAAVRAAARAAGAEAFINALPRGYDTPLGDEGDGLSAGQRQRIALARAFLRDAPLVLLDEPTANLDGATEAEVLAAVHRLARGRTVVLAAHRPTLAALAHRRVRL